MKGSSVTAGRVVDDSGDGLERHVLPRAVLLDRICSRKFGGGLAGNRNRLSRLDIQKGREIIVVPAPQKGFLSDHCGETLQKSLHGALDHGTGIAAIELLQIVKADQEHA